MIRTEKVTDEGSCRVKCYLEPNCVSVNFGPQEKGSHVCELNNATDESPTLSNLMKRKRYTYHAIEVCPKHQICNELSNGLTVRNGLFNPSTRNDEPSIRSHFARDLKKSNNNIIRESRNVRASTGSSRPVTDGDDPSTGSHFARD